VFSVPRAPSLDRESHAKTLPDAVFLGVSSFNYERCGMSDHVNIELDQADIKRAKQIAAYPWCAPKKTAAKELKKMLQNGLNMEVEALISKDLEYPTGEYLPMKLKDKKQWLDYKRRTTNTALVEFRAVRRSRRCMNSRWI